jgi:CRP-like cAMP-binding protein
VPPAPADRAIIRTLPIFVSLSDSELDGVLAGAKTLRFGAGQAVFEQGAAATQFFLLFDGRLKVHQVTADGQQIIVRMVERGDLCGMARAMQRTDYPGTAVAVVDSALLAWPTSLWDAWLGRHPVLAGRVMQIIGSRLQDAHTRIREMSTEAVGRRLAHTILRLVQESGRKEATGIRIDFPLTRQDVAEMSGTTLYTVSRTLKAWEAAGLVEVGRKKILIRDPHGLMLIAEGEEDRPGRP